MVTPVGTKCFYSFFSLIFTACTLISPIELLPTIPKSHIHNHRFTDSHHHRSNASQVLKKYIINSKKNITNTSQIKYRYITYLMNHKFFKKRIKRKKRKRPAAASTCRRCLPPRASAPIRPPPFTPVPLPPCPSAGLTGSTLRRDDDE